MKLEAQKRTAGTPDALRRDGRLPAILYNRELNVSVSVDTKAFDRVFRSRGTSSIIDLEVDGENHEVLVKQVQMDKRRRLPMHVDFYAVTAGQEVDVHIPVDFHGTAIGVRDGGLVDVHRREIHIAVIPRLIPNHLEIDISGLAIGDSIHVRDVQALLPPEARILDDEDLTLLSVAPPRLAEEAAEEEVAESTEPELISREREDEDDEGDEE